MEINLAPHLETLNARYIDSLISMYLSHVEGKPHTIATYAYLFGLFSRWWTGYGPPNNYQLSALACQNYAKWLENTNSSNTGTPLTHGTRSKALSKLRHLLQWAYRHGYIGKDFSHWIPAAKGRPTTIPAPSRDVLSALMDAAGRTTQPRRGQAILAVLIGTGIRRTECCGLDIEDVMFNADGSGTMHVREAKGGRPRVVVFDTVTGGYLSAHLDSVLVHHGPLFCGRNGQRLKPKSLYQFVRRCAKMANCQDEVRGPHDLRRLFATNWTQHNRGVGGLQPLSLQLGHTSAAMTLRYSRQGLQDVQEIFVSPLTDVTLPRRK